MAATSHAETWVWNPVLGVYHHAASETYALPNHVGDWTYLTPAELAARGADVGASSSTVGASSATTTRTAEMEEGEVEDDVGWGGLMDPDKLARVVASAITGPGASSSSFSAPGLSHERDHERERESKRENAPRHGNGHDPYGRDDTNSNALDPCARGRPKDDSTRSPTPSLEPRHILRLIVRRSKALPHGSIALLDARPGGIQIGRDRRGPGDTARLRVREMEVSKTHAVVYWGREGRVGVAVREARADGRDWGEDRWELGREEEDDSEGQCEDTDHGLDGGDRKERGDRAHLHDSNVDTDLEGWWIVDLGSTLGTYVAHRGEGDATRLSEAKHASTPFPIRHLSRVTVGTTTFVAHLHADWPCGECQLAGSEEIRLEDGAAEAGGASTPGDASPAPASAISQFDPPVGAAQRRGQRQFKRKLALDALRDKLLGDEASRHPDLGPGGPPSTGANSIAGGRGGGYLDRSSQRRRLHPPSPPRASWSSGGGTGTSSTITAPAQPAGPSAASRAMLARQGWTPGAGLGRDVSGRAEPIVAVLRSERVGIGARGQVADPGDGVETGDWRARGRQRRWDEIARS